MAGEEIDFAAEGLLDGLEGAEREERLALLRQLAGQGVPLEELHRSADSGRLVFLLADRVIGGPRSLTAEQVAERSGVSLRFLLDSRRAMGLPIPEPGEAAFTENDVEAARRSLVATEAGITEEDLLELLRVLGRGLGQAAEAMRALPLKLVLHAGISEQELAQHYGETVARLYPMVDPLMSDILALHLRHATETEIVGAAERDGGRLPGSRRVAIGFADLVGFTRLGEEVPPDELGRLATRLEAIALEVASPPVRLVKTIGDAVMLASPDPEPLLETALGLIDVAEGEGGDFPELRAGAALGSALARAGDWFGQPVNLASRITSVARPSSLLVDGLLYESVGSGFRASFAGQRRLKGIREPVALFRMRRAEGG
ncbi:MAG TPA: adenylate cyclase regulatory domain-containing protein [Solirubrobacteraceae bacterium]|nr:adenylate cyclase regulatory domain-containing protein [Solirubrobacteraceae bacterium]